MQLISFSVRNYRSITTAYRLPIKQSTILIGPNNEGKSNVLRALVASLKLLERLGGTARLSAGRLLLPFAPTIKSIYDWVDDYPVSLQGNPKGESVFDLQFELTDGEVQDFSKEVGSNLNGVLPIRVTMGADKAPGFSVRKRGPGATALTKKAERIANFVSKRISISYIPAVRTAEAAREVVSQMVHQALIEVEQDPAYQAALDELAKLQQPTLDNLSDGIKKTLQVFLPNVQGVSVQIPKSRRFRALRDVEVLVDDGSPTTLERKGGGVQSLAALGLLHQSSLGGAGVSKQLLLAIEEPESHLHPSAIHQLKEVLGEIANSTQVIMTTHCPLLVDRSSIRSNIIVHGNKAIAAKNISEIRDILGVRASDNLRHAELILVVEGEEDRVALRPIFEACSPILSHALKEGLLGIESLQGASNLSYKLSTFREALCNTHSFLDHDDAGRQAASKATTEGLLTPADVHFATFPGRPSSEIEDLYEVALYEGVVLNTYGVSLQSPKFKGNKKWSERLRETFVQQGKVWNDSVEMKVKALVAEQIRFNPTAALNPHTRGPVDALVGALEAKISALRANR